MRAPSTLIIDHINKEFNDGVNGLIQANKYKAEILIEKAIGFIPFLLFKLLGSEEELGRFCICINYASRLFPNKRFHIHTDAGEVKTFCWKKNDQFDFDDVSINYDLDSPFVKLLDIFYKINEIKSDNLENFSMNKYLDAKTEDRQATIRLDEQEYNQNVLKYLRDNYPVSNLSYFRYAAYLWIATGKIEDNPLLQNIPTSETDRLVLEVLSLIAYNYETIPLWHEFKQNDNYIQYNIPIFGLDNGQERIVCNIVIPSLVSLSDELISAISLLSNLWINRIWDYENITWAYANAVRAAIAQVMARNMSHNFGSHVLSNLVGDGVYEKLDDEAVKKLKSFNPKETDEVYKDLYKDLEESKKSAENNKSKNHQLQYFFQYLKSRMDYLSEVTFGVPNLLTTKMMYGEVMKELDQVRILLNYISGVSNFNYNFKLMIGDKEMTADNDIGVAFPSDVLGCHAFYNIIENIIRNTAKHANKDGNQVTFTITFKDIDGAGCENIEEAAELYCVEIDNGVREDNIDILVNGLKEKDKIVKEGQNTRLNDSVLDKNNNLRSHSLGLLEMEASAAFLRQLDMPEIESEDYHVEANNQYYHERNSKKRLNILKAFAIDVKEEEKQEMGETIKVNTGRLGYRFFVQKPKEFLFVGKSVNKDNEKQLLNYGIQFISKDDFITAMKGEKSFAHQFLLYADNDDIPVEIEKRYDSDCKTLLPLRKLSINNKDWETITSFWTKNDGSDEQSNEETRQGGKTILQQLKEWAWKKYAGNITEGLTADKVCVKGQASNKDYQVVLIDHGKSYKIEWKAIQKKEFTTKEGWVENMSSRTNGKLPQFEALLKTGKGEKPIQKYLDQLSISHPENGYIRIELFEAYHNKVVVIDERVQKFAAENFEGDGGIISCADLHRSTNVFIPDTDTIPLDPNDFGEYVKKVEDYIDKNIKDSFLLIHYGILERMYGRDEKTITDKLEGWAARGMAKRVVVTSGRGAHSLNLPKSVCFVNLSSALYVFNENRNKYIINYLLNQSRRKRNE